jgi:hypothetical protein
VKLAICAAVNASACAGVSSAIFSTLSQGIAWNRRDILG